MTMCLLSTQEKSAIRVTPILCAPPRLRAQHRVIATLEHQLAVGPRPHCRHPESSVARTDAACPDPPVAQNSFFAVAGMARARFRGMRTREGCPGIARDSGSRAPIGKRVIIEDRKTDRDPMLPAFHVDGDLHDIPSPALYPGKSRRPRRVKGVRGVQFEACIGLDAALE